MPYYQQINGQKPEEHELYISESNTLVRPSYYCIVSIQLKMINFFLFVKPLLQCMCMAREFVDHFDSMKRYLVVLEHFVCSHYVHYATIQTRAVRLRCNVISSLVKSILRKRPRGEYVSVNNLELSSPQRYAEGLFTKQHKLVRMRQIF